MNIIIPASGIGQRFIDAGYSVTKPLINVDDMKIIDYIFDAFSLSDVFHIIVSPETEVDMIKYVEMKKSQYDIRLHVYDGPKLGPVGCVVGVSEKLDIGLSDEVIVTYCDFGVSWDYDEFKTYLSEDKPDACIPTYSGYHPHLLNLDNVYAVPYTLDNSDTSEVGRVKEKCRCENPEQAKHSPGIYYFSKFGDMLSSFIDQIKYMDKTNGEYYVSLAYNHYIRRFPMSRVTVWNHIDKFYQFGTPADFEYVADALNDSKQFLRREPTTATVDNIVIIAAGRGERFSKLNYPTPKPFLPVNNKPLIEEIDRIYKARYPDTNLLHIGAQDHRRFWDNTTCENTNLILPNNIGAAHSYSDGVTDVNGSVLVLPCDMIQHEVIDDRFQFNIFVSLGTETQRANPTAFAWVKVDDNGIVMDISIKERLPGYDMILNGSFYAKSNIQLLDLIYDIKAKGLSTNGEFYLDNALKLAVDTGYSVKAIDVGFYYSFGTPAEYLESTYFYKG